MNNAKPKLILALELESQGLFEKHKIPVHYCGVGKVNASYMTMKLIAQGAPAILNLGTAGSCRFPSHQLIQCREFLQRDMDLTPLGHPRGVTPLDKIPGAITAQTLDLGLPWGVCGTADVFEVGPPNLPCDLVDMESYAMAKVCALEGVPFYSYKYITDGSDENSHSDWKENLKRASFALLEIYQSFSRLFDEQQNSSGQRRA